MRVVHLVSDLITCLDVLAGDSSQKPQGSNDSTVCDLWTFALVDMAHPVGLPFPGLLSWTGVSLPWQWSNKIIGNTNAGYQLLSRAVGAHVQRGFIGTDQLRLRSPSWRATAPMGESVPWGTRAGLTKIWGRDILWGKRQRLGSCCGKMLGNASEFIRTWQQVKNRRNVKKKNKKN